MTDTFSSFLKSFIGTAPQLCMQNTVENSPWHREENVWVHTQMCLAAFDEFAHKYTDEEQLIARLALLYHDTGKPVAEEVKTKGDGTNYRSYAGHEQHSAISFMEEYLANNELQKILNPQQARTVRWIIENHLPYGLKDKKKREDLFFATRAVVNLELFFDILRSDCNGRISDDHPTKKQNVENWIAEFRQIVPQQVNLLKGNTAYILVGPSASGKSTWTAQHASDAVVISFDKIRVDFVSALAPKRDHESAADFYARVWDRCADDPYFTARMNKTVLEQFKFAAENGKDVVIDNVNATKKRRRMFVDLARRHGYRIVGVEFWNSTGTLLQRQQTRGDKSVPASSVIQQQQSCSCLWVGSECDELQLLIGE